MRPTRTTVLLTAGLVTLLGVPAAAAAETPTNLYVNNQDGSGCSDTGAGTQAVPYCTISAAAKAVLPGQTVRIKPGWTYAEAVTIDRSGAPGKPISFVADGPAVGQQADLGKTVTVRGASHVVLGSLFARGGVQISGSTDVGLDRIRAVRGRLDSVAVDGASKDVRIGRSNLLGVRIEGGSQGTVLSRNLISGPVGPAVSAVDAPGTVVTNNTVHGYCGAALSIADGSTGAGLFNNVIVAKAGDSCRTDGARNAILIAQSATAGTVADYNLVASQVPYSWAGTTYPDPAAFHAATGQGGHDILNPGQDGLGPVEGSPTVDSADPTAPGVLPTDIDGRPTADDPLVPNTGKNGGYLDRGAYETHDGLSQTWMHVDQTWAPVGTKVEVQAVSDSNWPTAMSYHVDFGDGTPPVVTQQGTGAHGLATHAYSKAGDYVIKVTAVNAVGQKATTEKPVKVTAAGPLTAAFSAGPVLPAPDDTTTRVPPLTMSLDPSASATPWPVDRTEVDFGDGSQKSLAGLATATHTYSRPGDYKAAVTVVDVKGTKSTTTRSVHVDYARAGYVAVTPFRLKDTRVHGGTLQGGSPASIGMPAPLHASGMASGGMSAAVINVTLTGVTQDAYLNVASTYDDRPTTSSLNARAGATVSNTVTVPVGKEGQVWFYLNAGRADVIVDFVGYYQPNAGQKFSPVAPTRLADTRTAGGPVAGGTTRTVKVAGVGGIPADAQAVAVNLTSTEATQNSFVVAYPDPAKRPEPASNLNPEPGRAKSNQAIVPVGPDGTITLYNHAGSVQLIVDAVGYYGKDGKALFTPVVPGRLADTRTTGIVAAGGTTTVAGVPAGAVGAVLNLTATESTGAGFLTAYGFGSARPEASSLQTLPGLTVPNHVTTPVADGKVSVYNGQWGGPNHVIADLLGYFTQG
ncbi:PKD domain-containing protein [Streptomyces avidinii]|uniref:PKD domain-containing protein n=1 Tax=Streptomyces avidinii TaxID=1895 RepID=UPI00386A39D1|nr:PKD domain-containing protein [Streptomyces avidinii]